MTVHANLPQLGQKPPLPEVVKITQGEFHEAAIQKLHSIIMGELFVHGGYLHYADLVEKICDLFSQINTQGVLSAESLERLLGDYNDEFIRSFWGSVAMNMEYQLTVGFPGNEPLKHFINGVVRTFGVTAADLDQPSETEVALAHHRLITEKSHTFNNPVDFWIICLIAFRMTVGSSQVFPFIRSEYTRLKLAERPKRPEQKQVIVAA